MIMLFPQLNLFIPQFIPQSFELKLKSLKIKDFQAFFSDPEGIRTPDPQIRNLLLYPAELRDHAQKKRQSQLIGNP